MSKFIIVGGKKLSGEIETSSGKNAPIALLFASLVVRGVVVLRNMSRAEEVLRVLEMFESVGVKLSWTGANELTLDTGGDIDMGNINKESCAVTRISLLFLGALASTHKDYRLARSGGCSLGERTVRPHLYALHKFGIHIKSKNHYYEISTQKLNGGEIIMHEAGDTATENAILASVQAHGESKILFASSNYMVQDMCFFLKKAGAKISGIGTSFITVGGDTKFKKKVVYDVMPDPVDAFAFVSLAIVTKSNLIVKNCPILFMKLELERLRSMGQRFNLLNHRLSRSKNFEIVDIEIIPSSLEALVDKLHPLPFPGINIDAVPLFVPILAIARGKSLVHDWIYENRAVYYQQLQRLGVKTLLLDLHRIIIEGPTDFSATDMICPPAIRPGFAILIAMLAARGVSTLSDVYPIIRAYDNLVPRLQAIGANIIQE